ncbi:hypothetical protein SAMN05428996_2501 [Quadrisphaera sp. DSM 44207]|nr:hypothetical protein SAMN05428996_2501 [Quadrisphaera sp. DSM 44207]
MRRSLLRALGITAVLGVLGGGVWAGVQQVLPDGSTVLVERCTALADGVEHDLAPDQAGNAALITAVAQQRGLPARAATIALATAVQESKLRNIAYGDRDSLGLFQQRPSQGWGTPEQVQDPLHSTGAFYDVLVQVDGYEDLPITDVAQRVQRSGFPLAYADHEPEGRAYASALTGYSPAALTCRLRPVEGAQAQRPGEDGYWPRTAAVVQRLHAERGDGVPTTPVDDGADVVLGAGGTGPDAVREGWSLAHWAVAHAADLQVVSVATEGRVWRREDPEAGWQPVEGEDAALAAPPGAALVQVAAGDG